MKYFTTVLLIAILTLSYGQSVNKSLVQFFENGKIGFIDPAGQVAINSRFFSAGEFSEGLAYARDKGVYGYIDYTGSFVIQPQFDYATPFSEGLAIVYQNGIPLYINKNGQQAFETHFPFMGQFNDGRAIIKTSTDKWGVINKQGKLIIDTVFSELNPIEDGLFIVHGLNHHPYADAERGIVKKYEVGVVDTLGDFVIPYGKFEEIEDYENGYFVTKIPEEPWDSIDGYSAINAIVDRTGKIIISKDHKNHCYLEGNLHCGLAKMYLYKYWIPEEKGVISTSEKSYEGYMNSTGEIFINDTSFKTVEDFSDNRAFVTNDERKYSIINTKGEFVAKDAYNRLLGDGFDNGLAFVAVDWKWGLIDTNANFVIAPQFSSINEVGMIDDYFFFGEPVLDKKGGVQELTGVAKKDGSILIRPIMQDFDFEGFKHGLLKCVVNGKLTYLNNRGDVIWQEIERESNQLTNLNIDFMNRVYFYASSKPNKKDIGGFGGSDNAPKIITKREEFPEKKVSVIVHPEMKDTIFCDYHAIKVFVANTSKNKIEFNAQDSRLEMKVQAQDSIGEWKDIEYLPSSWCGNSYHRLTLDRNYYWTFLTPVYDGDFKTKLRIELKYIDPKTKSKNDLDEKEIIIYSNEYEGSINPGQFWRPSGYSPEWHNGSIHRLRNHTIVNTAPLARASCSRPK